MSSWSSTPTILSGCGSLLRTFYIGAIRVEEKRIGKKAIEQLAGMGRGDLVAGSANEFMVIHTDDSERVRFSS
ncbi:hypothetical protein HPP92_016154 [Vanilla planifolia]|uniref:Uncharacterized protein n=1 Tax=Vanilla planifolia TaxID=51239 RepID=A0A835QH13_VANPL|nr:hypothetical protein HPP92_016154 [Vanilla planifolia]